VESAVRTVAFIRSSDIATSLTRMADYLLTARIITVAIVTLPCSLLSLQITPWIQETDGGNNNAIKLLCYHLISRLILVAILSYIEESTLKESVNTNNHTLLTRCYTAALPNGPRNYSNYTVVMHRCTTTTARA